MDRILAASALRILWRVNHEVTFPTARRLLCDCLNIVDASAVDILKSLIDEGRVVYEKGWLVAK